MQRVHEVAGVLDGVLEVSDGLLAAALAPEALLGSLGLVLDLTESDLLWAVEENTKWGGEEEEDVQKGALFSQMKGNKGPAEVQQAA